MSNLVTGPDQGKSIEIQGLGIVFKLSGADTGGAFALVEHPRVQDAPSVYPCRNPWTAECPTCRSISVWSKMSRPDPACRMSPITVLPLRQLTPNAEAPVESHGKRPPPRVQSLPLATRELLACQRQGLRRSFQSHR